jgi:hypothetical protein
VIWAERIFVNRQCAAAYRLGLVEPAGLCQEDAQIIEVLGQNVVVRSQGCFADIDRLAK